MSFTPKNNKTSSASNGESRNYPTPKPGSRRARVSLIVDLGEQNREPIYKLGDEVVNESVEGAIAHQQKPCQQVAVFADLVADTVDYGGDIGKAHYRLMLNNTFNGVLKGINFAASPPKDAKGNTIAGKPWGFHPQNLLTKLAKAVEKPEVIESMNLTQLLGLQFMAEVDVNEKDSGKKDTEGKDIIYKNVNFKGASKVAALPTGEQDDNGDDIEAAPEFAQLKTPALCVTFTNAKKEDIKFLRPNIIKQIKLANDYAGSQIQKAIEAYESEDKPVEPEKEAPAKVATPVAKTKAPAKAKAPVIEDEDEEEPSPF